MRNVCLSCPDFKRDANYCNENCKHNKKIAANKKVVSMTKDERMIKEIKRMEEELSTLKQSLRSGRQIGFF